MATVSRESIGELNDKITVKVSGEDYLPSFEKALKSYSKNANIPGFRKGMVPTGMIKKMHGQALFTDEVLRTVEKQLGEYMNAEKLEIFAQPLPLPENDARNLDFNQPSEYSFAFEVGLKPTFTVADISKIPFKGYKVTIPEEMITEEIERLQMRHGNMAEPETVTSDDNVLTVTMSESDENGVLVENGATKENSILVKYFAESFRPQLMGKKAGESFVIQIATAFDEKEQDWVIGELGLDKSDSNNANKYFSVEITKLGLVERAELNESFFLQAYPNKTIATEAEFREVIKGELSNYWAAQTRNQLHDQVFHALVDETNIEFPIAFLKRWLQTNSENPKTAEDAEKEFPNFKNQLKWTLIVEQIVKDNNIEVLPEDLKAFARQQLFGYMGMPAGGEEQPWIEDYVNRMMKDRKFVEDSFHRVQTEKVFQWSDTQVNPVEEPISIEAFTKMVQEHQH